MKHRNRRPRRVRGRLPKRTRGHRAPFTYTTPLELNYAYPAGRYIEWLVAHLLVARSLLCDPETWTSKDRYGLDENDDPIRDRLQLQRGPVAKRGLLGAIEAITPYIDVQRTLCMALLDTLDYYAARAPRPCNLAQVNRRGRLAVLALIDETIALASMHKPMDPHGPAGLSRLSARVPYTATTVDYVSYQQQMLEEVYFGDWRYGRELSFTLGDVHGVQHDIHVYNSYFERHLARALNERPDSAFTAEMVKLRPISPTDPVHEDIPF